MAGEELRLWSQKEGPSGSSGGLLPLPWSLVSSGTCFLVLQFLLGRGEGEVGVAWKAEDKLVLKIPP